MQYSLTAIVKIRLGHVPGSTNSQHEGTDLRLEVSKNLDQQQYNDKRGLPTAKGSQALTLALVQGLVGNIHAAHQKGYRDSAEHLRHIISELERGFIKVATAGEGEM